MKYISIVFIMLLLTSGCSKEEVSKEKENGNIKVDEKLTYEENIEDVEEIISEVEEPIEIKKESTNNTSTSEKNEEVVYTEKDISVIENIETIEDNVDVLLNEEDTTSVSSKAKGVFISFVDFVFYDGKINGVTFDELSDAGKEKVLKLVNSIDIKIENKVPGYKDTISEKTGNAYNKASELIKKGASNINEFAQDKMGDEYYQMMIDAKDELISYTKNAVSIIGSAGSNAWDKAKDSLSNWYQNFKNSN